MNESDILCELQNIFIEILGDNSIKLNHDKQLAELTNWNSLNHVLIIEAIENHYKIKFELADMLEFLSVGDICNNINKKVSSR